MSKEKDRVAQYIKRFDALKEDASSRDDWINRIAAYAVPTLYNVQYDQTSHRSNLPADVYDSSMLRASNIFAAGLYSYLTNPSNKWMSLTLSDLMDMEAPGVKDYLEFSENSIFKVLSASNFYSVIHQGYRSLTFGNCVIYRERDPKTVVRYHEVPLAQCYFELDASGRVNAMYRLRKRTPMQLIEEFGENNVDKQVIDMAKNNNIKRIDCLHIVRPRENRDVRRKDKLNKVYESIHIDKDHNVLMKEDGYDKFPFFIGHFIRDSYSAYSYGPGHLCFYDGKSLNQLVLSILRRASKEADPPVSLPHDGYVLPFLQDPGSVNYRTADDPKDTAEYIVPPPASSVVRESVNDMRQGIREAFFVDLFLSITETTKRMTTVEVQERIAEKAPMLGPAIGTLTSEFLNYIIEDLVEIMLEDGLLPPVPQSLQGKNYNIEYLSPLAKAQKVSEFNSLQAFSQFLGAAVQFDQNVVDNVDFDKYIRIAADTTGTPQSIIREMPDVKSQRKQRLEAQARIRGKQELVEAAGAAKDATAADKNIAQAREQ